MTLPAQVDFERLLDDYVRAYIHWYEHNSDSFARKRDETRAALLAAYAQSRAESDALRGALVGVLPYAEQQDFGGPDIRAAIDTAHAALAASRGEG